MAGRAVRVYAGAVGGIEAALGDDVCAVLRRSPEGHLPCDVGRRRQDRSSPSSATEGRVHGSNKLRNQICQALLQSRLRHRHRVREW